VFARKTAAQESVKKKRPLRCVEVALLVQGVKSASLQFVVLIGAPNGSGPLTSCESMQSEFPPWEYLLGQPTKNRPAVLRTSCANPEVVPDAKPEEPRMNANRHEYEFFVVSSEC